MVDLRVNYEALRGASARFSSVAADVDLGMLRRVQTAQSDFGDHAVQQQMAAVGCALSQAAVVVVEAAGVSSVAVMRILAGTDAADTALALDAETLRTSRGGM